MTILKAQVALHAASGLPADDSINTFHFTAADADIVDYQAIAVALNNFYLGAPAGTALIGSMGGLTSATTRIYDIDVLPSGPPVYEDTFDFPDLVGDTLPQEVALCLSFYSAIVPGASAGTARGRVYIGPIRDVAVAYVGGVSRPNAVIRSQLRSAGEALMNDPDTNWVTYSPTRRAAGFVPTTGFVVGGFVDDEWDTQRRRGRGATTRDTFGV